MSTSALPRSESLTLLPAPVRAGTTPTSTRRPSRTSGTAGSSAGEATPGPSVSCVFCREPIELQSFGAGDHQTRTATCSNCGLRVSVTAATWAQWCQADTVSVVERSLGERLRARRIATAAQLILQKVALTDEGAMDGASP